MTRLSDPWNDYDALKGEVEELRDMGMDVSGQFDLLDFAAPHR